MKRIAAVVVAGICLGAISLFIQKVSGVEDDVFMRGYLIASTTIVVGAVLVNLLYSLNYYVKTRRLARLLDEEDPDGYVAGIESLLKTARGHRLKDLLNLNLAAGLIETKRFDDAITLLESLPERHLKRKSEIAARRINLCIAYFEAGRYEKSLALIDESRPLFEGCPYDASVASVDIMAAIMEKRFDQAQIMLEEARDTHRGPRFQKAFEDLSRILEAQRTDPEN